MIIFYEFDLYGKHENGYCSTWDELHNVTFCLDIENLKLKCYSGVKLWEQ